MLCNGSEVRESCLRIGSILVVLHVPMSVWELSRLPLVAVPFHFYALPSVLGPCAVEVYVSESGEEEQMGK